MAKDPAFLFYSQDFIVGTLTMSFEDKGKYITILAMMHQQGRLTEETIRILVGNISDNLKLKFQIDNNNRWFNSRLEYETEKRNQFVDSRRINGALGGRPPKKLKPNVNPTNKPNDKPIKNLSEDEIEDVIKDINSIELKEKFNQLFKTKKWSKKAKSSLQAAIDKSRKYDPDFMISLIDKALIGEYQGLFFSDTDGAYQKYIKLKSDLGQKQTKETIYSSPDTKF